MEKREVLDLTVPKHIFFQQYRPDQPRAVVGSAVN